MHDQPSFADWSMYRENESSFMEGVVTQQIIFLIKIREYPLLLLKWRDIGDILKNFSKPTLAIFGKYDMSFRDQDKYIIEKIPGAKGLNHRWIEAGHFSQENQPELIAKEIIDLV